MKESDELRRAQSGLAPRRSITWVRLWASNTSFVEVVATRQFSLAAAKLRAALTASVSSSLRANEHGLQGSLVSTSSRE